MKTQFFIGLTLLAVLITACVPTTVVATPPPIITEEPIIPVTGVAIVQSVEVQMLGINPIQVTAVVRGQLPDAGCTSIATANQVREGNTFTVTLMTAVNPAATCLATLTPFEQVISLNVSNLVPGTYIVHVNGVEASFSLTESNKSTNVTYVMAEQDVSIYDGRSTQNSVIGFVASGQIAKVTGISADADWWRVMCPDDTVGNCWVTANPAYTQPTQKP